MISLYLASFFASLVLSFILTRLVRDMAVIKEWIAAPSSHHIHLRLVPRLGGVAIFISFALVVGLLTAASILFQFDAGLSIRTTVYLLAPGALVFLLGLYDDVRSLSPYVKFAVQALAATMLFFGGFKVFQLPFLFGPQKFGWLALPLTILWVLWITNAFNLIDGLDGLAAGSSLFATVTVFVVSLINGPDMISLLTIGLAGSILGFLRYNFSPATIFLGDSGSLFIGFMLSALALAGMQKTPTMIAVAIPIVSFGLPVLETALSIFRRFLSGQPLFAGDREHIHHKLLERGLSQRQVVVVLYGVSALCGLLSLFLLYPGGGLVGIVFLVLGAGIWMAVQHLGYQEFAELKRFANRTIEQKRVIANNLAIRRAATKLSAALDYDQLLNTLHEAFETNDFDSFRLSLLPVPVELSAPAETIFSKQDRRSEQRYVWHKTEPSAAASRAAAPEWTLTFELITTRKQRRGYFSLCREMSDRALLVDINLIATEFCKALADALDRTVNQDEQYSPAASISSHGAEIYGGKDSTPDAFPMIDAKGQSKKVITQ